MESPRVERTTSPRSSIDCPRLQLDTFDDCTYEEQNAVVLDDRDSVEAFCQSTCDKLGTEVILWGPFAADDDIRPKDLAVLKGLKAVNSINLDDANTLESLHGLESLERINDVFYIRYCDSLTSIEALSSLREIGSNMELIDSDNLQSLAGLESLKKISAMILEYNDELRSIEALSGLEELSGLAVEDNPKLPRCQAEALADKHGLSGDDVAIANNGSGTCDD